LPACALALAFGQASALARGIPHWLKAPYQHYALVYEAGDSSNGTIETSIAPSEGFTACSFTNSTLNGAQAFHTTIRYAFVFGRFQAPGHRPQLAFVYNLASRSTSGRAELTSSEAYPPGCPTPSERYPPGGPSETCSEGFEEVEPPSIELGANVADTRFAVEMFPSVRPHEAPECHGTEFPPRGQMPKLDEFDDAAKDGAAPDPGEGAITFTAAGIRARHRFHGTVKSDLLEGIRTGQGSEAGEHGELTHWTFADGFTGSLTLAPASAHG
jgi:hypothetical protein